MGFPFPTIFVKPFSFWVVKIGICWEKKFSVGSKILMKTRFCDFKVYCVRKCVDDKKNQTCSLQSNLD